MRYFIELQYKGTNFAGWQIQPNAETIQSALEKALCILLKEKFDVVGSSRTDAGVHAQQQFAHFDVQNPIASIPDLVYRLNKMISHDIAIKQIFEVVDDYHSRFEALSRKYEYRISRKKMPFFKETAYQFESELDIGKMNKCCEVLFKHEDFECFSKIHTQVFTFNCKIMEARWEERGDMLVFHIQSNRFLRGMVRAIVGTLLDVGLGRTSLEDFENIILSKSRQNAGRAVPAHGLFLMEVNY